MEFGRPACFRALLRASAQNRGKWMCHIFVHHLRDANDGVLLRNIPAFARITHLVHRSAAGLQEADSPDHCSQPNCRAVVEGVLLIQSKGIGEQFISSSDFNGRKRQFVSVNSEIQNEAYIYEILISK
ncbi:hypothetical protein DAI22_07g078100 [Oryza sativa Japonica Group]|nr:hypothetical protein DAI22_07g078100 [Oryza sativa Japonica Group]